MSWPSTAGAAMSLLSESSDSGIGAAICSASAVDDESELEVLHEGTQAIDGESSLKDTSNLDR